MSRLNALFGWLVERYDRWAMHRQGLLTAQEWDERLNDVDADIKAFKRAAALGAEAGKEKASWVFDGNTSRENYEMYLRLSEDGDPALDEVYGPRGFWLSGEDADSMTPALLAEELDIRDSGLLGLCCDRYEEEADIAYHHELERVARLHTKED